MSRSFLFFLSQGIGSWPPSVGRGDPLSCDYWRHCAIDGYLCGCCGGSVNSCPPGTEISPVSWIGTCTNPVDGNNYVISYNDCCGKSTCGRCFCNTNEGDKPVYIPSRQRRQLVFRDTEQCLPLFDGVVIGKA